MRTTLEPSGARVLVVDHRLDTVDSTATLLRLGGYDVKTALTGSGAIRLAGQFRPDIAVIDLAIPGVDGYETAAGI
jgi:CheY-like chemotaxis protein